LKGAQKFASGGEGWLEERKKSKNEEGQRKQEKFRDSKKQKTGKKQRDERQKS
jgi:hypothetical protein